MTRTVNVARDVVFGKETAFGQGASSFTQQFGYIQRFRRSVDNQVRQVTSIGQKNYLVNIDSVINISGSLEWFPTDGRELQIIGALTDDGVSSWSIDVGNSIPSWEARASTDSSNYTSIKGLKFTKVELRMAKGEEVLLTSDWLAKSITQTAGTINTITPSEDPMFFINGEVKIDGVSIASVNSITATIDFQSEAVRGIENPGSREISEIVEKLTKITWTMDVDITDTSIWDKLITTRSDFTLQLNMGNGTKTMTWQLTGSRITSGDDEIDASGDIATQSVNGVSLSASISGTY